MTILTANLLTGGVDRRFQRTDATGTYSYFDRCAGQHRGADRLNGGAAGRYSYGRCGSMSVHRLPRPTATATPAARATAWESTNYRARYYNPATRRHISETRRGFRAGPNFYAYVADSPLNFNDPFGLDRGPGAAAEGKVPVPQVVQALNAPPLLFAPIASLENSFHNTVCAALSPLTSAAQGLGSTIGVGVGGNAGVGFILGVAVDGSVELVADRSGNVGLAITAGGNPGYGVFGIGGMRGVQASVSTVNWVPQSSGGPTWDFGVSGTLPLAQGVAGPSVARC